MGYGGDVSGTSPRHVLPRRGLPLLLALTLTVLAPAVGAGAAAEPVFTFTGGGWGHSVGMSQYGAYGMALEGYTFDQILANYYPTAPLVDADPALVTTPIWVNLTQEQSAVTLVVKATGDAATVPVLFTQGGASLSALSGETVTVATLPDGTCSVTAPAGSMVGPCSIDAAWDGFERAPTTRLVIGSTSYARGVLHFRPDNDPSNTIDVSLEILLEDYLLGLGEMPASWGANGGMEALKAQVVAARSYALNRVISRGDPAGRPFCWCQLYDTTTDQVYSGWRESSPYTPWLQAVAATSGKVLGTSTKPSGTQYSSSTFGWTESGSDDRWALKPEVHNPNARWSVSFSPATLAAKLGMANVTGVRVSRCSSVTGSAAELTFTGTGGSRVLSTDSLRTTLGLKSRQVISVGAPIPGNPACPGPGLIPSDTKGGPAALAGVSISDVGSGNGDGLAQCGEGIELTPSITNPNGSLSGLTGTLSSTDQYLKVTGGASAAFPNLGPGATAASQGHWDLSIDPATPAGYTANLDLVVAAAEAGPWSLVVSISVACGNEIEGVMATPRDVGGSGDIATAYAANGGPARLQIRDGASGSVVFSVDIAPAGFTPVDITVVPNRADSAADEVAVLLIKADGSALIAALDAGTGTLLASTALPAGYRYPDLETLPSFDGSPGSDLALLRVGSDKLVHVLTIDAGTGAIVGAAWFGTKIIPAALETLPNIGRTSAPEVVVLGKNTSGDMQWVIRDAATGGLIRTKSMGIPFTPIDIELVQLPGRRNPSLVSLVRASSGVPIRLNTSDALTGITISRVSIRNLASASDLKILANLGGGTAPDVAILGTATDGSSVASVIDPISGKMLSAPEFPSGYEVWDLSIVPGGKRLAAFGISAAGSVVKLREALSGVLVGSMPIP
jgi:SpoIID/LytB domain protein